MPELKLPRLPDRNPVKVTITLRPELNTALQIYAEMYRENYGDEETVAELIPYMLQGFLDADRSFAKAVKDREGAPPALAQRSRNGTSQENANKT